ncbi:uncharacterized protein N7459_008320 [Penicillium hispanicum]|uniref:uncharacterized protein n=1 Tax=Penicillium hispanicum TaxID=1080232 RepID=UPI002541F256|nr:uncharacterized protein N7459_008320 [Penicillium hispanicum]KAJ5573893.1 hypothetical protein N7459_008320 [Penicillium hispanicum]
MSPKTFSLSAALCLILAVGPATVLSAPQLNGVPLLGGDDKPDAAPATGNNEHDAGAGFDVGIPGGPGVNFGAGTHSETHGPCGPGVDSEHNAGAGYDVGIPGGPGVRFGAGTHDQHDAVPCPEPVPETTTTPTSVPVLETTTPAPLPVLETTTTPAPLPVTPETISEASTTSTYIPVMIPPTYTTPVVIPTITTAPAYAPPTPSPVRSTPLSHHAAPSSMPSSMPAFNAGSVLAPSSSLLAIALPIILGLFH